jgi:hypothetical protein
MPSSRGATTPILRVHGCRSKSEEVMVVIHEARGASQRVLISRTTFEAVLSLTPLYNAYLKLQQHSLRFSKRVRLRTL